MLVQNHVDGVLLWSDKWEHHFAELDSRAAEEEERLNECGRAMCA